MLFLFGAFGGSFLVDSARAAWSECRVNAALWNVVFTSWLLQAVMSVLKRKSAHDFQWHFICSGRRQWWILQNPRSSMIFPRYECPGLGQRALPLRRFNSVGYAVVANTLSLVQTCNTITLLTWDSAENCHDLSHKKPRIFQSLHIFKDLTAWLIRACSVAGWAI